MLYEFLSANREVLVERCAAKVVKRTGPQGADAAGGNGIPMFLDQLIQTLKLDQTFSPKASAKVSGAPEPAKTPVYSEIGMSAARHGSELHRQGMTIDQVVHDYGDLCQAITELAMDREEPMTVAEFHTMNRCLDNGIADAVTEFGRQRDNLMSTQGANAMGERIGVLSHELRNALNGAMMANEAIRRGVVGAGGPTGAMLDRSLVRLRNIIDHLLTDVKLTVGMPVQAERIVLAELIGEIQVGSQLEANARGCVFTAWPVVQGVTVYADRQMLTSAVDNLLQNAFKFTRPHSHVSLKAYAAGDRALIEVQDECGGLPDGTAEILFRPFEQRAADRTGLGLGLSIARRSVEANRGTIRVRNLPGTGCEFTIDLPTSPESAGTGALLPRH